MQTYDYPIVTGIDTVVVRATRGVNASFGWFHPDTYGILISVACNDLPGSFVVGQISQLYEVARKRSDLKFVVDSVTFNSIDYGTDEASYQFATASGRKQIPDNIIFERTFLPLVLKQRNNLIF